MAAFSLHILGLLHLLDRNFHFRSNILWERFFVCGALLSGISLLHHGVESVEDFGSFPDVSSSRPSKRSENLSSSGSTLYFPASAHHTPPQDICRRACQDTCLRSMRHILASCHRISCDYSKSNYRQYVASYVHFIHIMCKSAVSPARRSVLLSRNQSVIHNLLILSRSRYLAQ